MTMAVFKEKVKYAFYTVSHPADGFYEIRHRERGSVLVAILLTMLFSFSFSINRISACFIVNDVDPRNVDSFNELIIGNWSITCLLDGKGRLKDIIIAIGYSTVPATFCFLLATFVSQFITLDEAAFYYMILGIGIAYTFFMMLIGIMTVHNFTLGKTIVTLFLTLVALLLIIFILLLLVNLVNQVYSFLHSIYQELIFRS